MVIHISLHTDVYRASVITLFYHFEYTVGRLYFQQVHFLPQQLAIPISPFTSQIAYIHIQTVLLNTYQNPPLLLPPTQIAYMPAHVNLPTQYLSESASFSASLASARASFHSPITLFNLSYFLSSATNKLGATPHTSLTSSHTKFLFNLALFLLRSSNFPISTSSSKNPQFISCRTFPSAPNHTRILHDLELCIYMR